MLGSANVGVSHMHLNHDRVTNIPRNLCEGMFQPFDLEEHAHDYLGDYIHNLILTNFI